MKIESSDGKPYNPNIDYGVCTCAKRGCTRQIRYAIAEKTWRPRYCKEHIEDEMQRIINNGRTEREAYESTHIQLIDIHKKSYQECFE